MIPVLVREVAGQESEFLVNFVALTFFFFTDTATTEIYTLSLHDALPICCASGGCEDRNCFNTPVTTGPIADRKSTRLNSSHGYISYAVFCLKKKTNTKSEHEPVIDHRINLGTTT